MDWFFWQSVRPHDSTEPLAKFGLKFGMGLMSPKATQIHGFKLPTITANERTCKARSGSVRAKTIEDHCWRTLLCKNNLG